MKFNRGTVIGFIFGLIVGLLFLIQFIVPGSVAENLYEWTLVVLTFPFVILGIIIVMLNYQFPIGPMTQNCHYAYGCVSWATFSLNMLITIVGSAILYAVIGHFLGRLFIKIEQTSKTP